MVASLGALVGYAGVGSLTLAGVTLSAGGALTLAGVAVNVAGAALLSKLTQPKIDLPKPENVQTNSKVAVAPRLGHYGLVKVGGNAIFHRAKDGKSYRIFCHGHGEITQILQRYLNNEPVDLDGSGFVTDGQYQRNGRSRVQVFERMGQIPEVHYGQLTAIWPAWTASHRLDGQWSSLLICESVGAEHFRKMYPNGEPHYSVLAETKRCYDPRNGQTAFTENAALIIADYIASPDGLNRTQAIDWGNIAEQADICDRAVALAEGGTEPLYRISGSYALNEKPQAVLDRMLASCAGRLRLTASGKVSLKVGAWSEPEFTLTFADLLELQEATPGPDALDRFNELPARFVSHDLGHVEVDAEPWLDDARVALDGEVRPGDAIDLQMSPSHRQARQVMKIVTERENPLQELTLLCKPRALPALYEDMIALDVPELGLAGSYEVVQHNVSFERGNLKAVRLTLRKIDAAAFTLALAEQGAVQLLPEPDTPSGVPLPQGVVAVGAGVQTAQNVFVAGIGVGWQAPPSDALSPLLRYSLAGAGGWQDFSVSDDAVSAHLTGLSDGVAYDISLAFVTPGGVVGPAVVIENVIATAVSSPPEPPTGLQVSDAGGGSALIEMTASTSESLWKTEIYRDAVLVGVVYTGPGSEIAFIDNSGAGTFDWTARSVNVSNINSSVDAGPVAATIA